MGWQTDSGTAVNIRSTAQLIDWVNHGNKVKYVFFWGHQEKGSEVTKSCFSQWYDAGFEVDGQSFLSAEHYMMYQKARLFADGAACERVLAAGNPAKAKAVGREVVGFDQQRWEEARFEIVIDANMAKFSQNPELKAFLLFRCCSLGRLFQQTVFYNRVLASAATMPGRAGCASGLAIWAVCRQTSGLSQSPSTRPASTFRAY